MTTSTLLNFDADARDRLWEMLELRGISCRDQLERSTEGADSK